MGFKDKGKAKAYMRRCRARKKANRDTDFFKRRYRRLKTRVERNQRIIAAMKQFLGCTRCSENDPDCLDFHHIDASTKKLTVSNSVRTCGHGWRKLMDEILKCEILCANCHRKEEAKRRRNK